MTKPKLQRCRYAVIRWYWGCLVKTVNRRAYLNHMLEAVPADEPSNYIEEIDEIHCLESRGWPKRGHRVHLSIDDIPLPEGQSSHWGSAKDGKPYILSESLRKFKEIVEGREYEYRRRKREGREMWIKRVTAGAAVIAATASLANLLASHCK